LDLVLETIAFGKVKEQLQAASAETDNVILTGDMNLDTSRRLDMRYRRKCLMLAHDNAVAEANMRYLEKGITYRSHGLHCCTAELPGLAKPIPEALKPLQVAVNNVARSIVGCRREDHVTVKDLLGWPGTSVNQLVVKSTAMAAWSAYVSNDGQAGTRSPVGRLLLDSDQVGMASRPTRATTAGEVCVPTRGVKTFVTHGLKI
jgi:hypothetical protein